MEATIQSKKSSQGLPSSIQVLKRDGSRQTFRISNLIQSILKAMPAPSADLAQSLAQRLMGQLKEQVTSQEIADCLLTLLRFEGFPDTADAYAAYQESKLTHRRHQFDVNGKIAELQAGNQAVVNENANKDSRVFNTMRDLTAGVTAKAIGLSMLPKAVANGHLKGAIHFHDLDYFPYSPMTNCCLIDVETMLNQGFHIGNAEVESPRSINTATAQIAQIIANVASSQYGGCSIDRIDEVLEPFAQVNFDKNLELARQLSSDDEVCQNFAKDKTQKDIFDAMQSLEYEINTLYSSNGQTPFTTLGFGLGQSWLSREIQKAILKIRLQGLGRQRRTAIFPKLVFSLKKGLNLQPQDPNYDIKRLAIECATKRMYPDVVNYDTLVKLTGSFKVPMGCRSFLQGWKDENGQEVNVGRMNLGVVTLNLPRIAMESVEDKDQFWQIFEERLELLEEALAYRIHRVNEARPENAPILYQEGAFGHYLSESDSVNQVFKNKRATLSMGYIGLYETTAYFYGPDWEDNPEAKAFSLEIMRVLKSRADALGNQYGYHFSVYSTPSESLTDRFCRLDQEKFGSVKDITDKGYYTNSFHYDIRKAPTPFEKLDFEKDYAPYTSGGFIHYCEYPNLKQNPKALEAVWDYAYDKVGYLGTNTPIDHCYACGYDGDFQPTDRGFKCPSCGNANPDACDVVKRTCGYLGNPNIRPMVQGRHTEIVSRVKHLKVPYTDDKIGQIKLMEKESS